MSRFIQCGCHEYVTTVINNIRADPPIIRKRFEAKNFNFFGNFDIL